MSGRPKIVRKVSIIPIASGFRPYGMTQSAKKKDSIFLYYEEYEALRLCDYEKHTQVEASVFMNVSRPTLTRIYISAREKIAQAFVEGRNIIIEGGKVCFNNEWYVCHSCKSFFNDSTTDKSLQRCPLCGSSEFHNYDEIIDDVESLSVNWGNSKCGRGLCSNRRKRGRRCANKNNVF